LKLIASEKIIFPQDINKWALSNPSQQVIYPYFHEDKTIIQNEETLRKKYKNIYRYLLENKIELALSYLRQEFQPVQQNILAFFMPAGGTRVGKQITPRYGNYMMLTQQYVVEMLAVVVK